MIHHSAPPTFPYPDHRTLAEVARDERWARRKLAKAGALTLAALDRLAAEGGQR